MTVPFTPPTVARLLDGADRDPHAVCVQDPDGLTTRAELCAQVRRIERALTKRIGSGALVAVLLGRDRHLPAALLGVHASGSAYLTVDEGMPDARIAALLRSVPVAAVVTSRPLAGRVPDGMPNLLVDDMTWAPRGRPPDRPADRLFGGVAYLLYTSGSTGAPKCVQVGHRSLEVHMAGVQDVVGGPAGRLDGQVWQAVSPIGFDSHITEILVALTGGAMLCLGPRDPLAIMSGPLVTSTGDGRRVTHMQCTPSLLRLLAGDPDAFAALRSMEVLLIGGEPFPTELVPRFAGARVRLFNVYGPTEATVWVAGEPVPSTPVVSAPVPVGRAVAGARLRILDDRGAEVPDGVSGRLFLGGECLAHGYHGDPVLTARRFVPDPWSTHGGRLYDTGDLAVRDAAGRIVVTGRADNQIKVRGNRVELDEIELTLRSHPLIADAVVLPDRRPDARTLRATVAAPGDLDLAALHRWLSARLAPYQIPTQVDVRADLPHNLSGKVDRHVT